VKNTFGLIDEATDSGLNPLRNIQNTGKKKMSTKAQVSTLMRVFLAVLVIDFLQP
jgi:hypothetical protein